MTAETCICIDSYDNDIDVACLEPATHRVGIIKSCGHDSYVAAVCVEHATEFNDECFCGVPCSLTEAVRVT